MAKTKALSSCAVTAQPICVFVFPYANCWFSHVKAHISVCRHNECTQLSLPKQQHSLSTGLPGKLSVFSNFIRIVKVWSYHSFDGLVHLVWHGLSGVEDQDSVQVYLPIFILCSIEKINVYQMDNLRPEDQWSCRRSPET